MRISLGLGICAIGLLALGVNAPGRADGLEWLGGDAVEVAAHRMGLMGQHSDKPLMGYLARPEGAGRHPAVIVLHGCGGFGAYYPVIADVLKSYGYVALAIDSLDGLDVCASGIESGDVAEAFDAYAALDWLARQDFVDPDRVALLGISLGGFATLDDVEAGPGAIEKTQKRHFRAAVAYYPGCRDRAGVMTVPTFIVIGNDDDWTLASWCQDMMARRNGKGAPVTLVVYPGATHGFNFPASARQYLGHHMAYDPQATADAWRQVRDFLHTTLSEAQPAGPTGETR
jgi:dienelactone hydrolase